MSDLKKQIPNDIKLYNAIPIANDNIAIKRIKDKCIDCGLCRTVCEEREGIKDICDGKLCVYCGQCIQSCPVNAIVPKCDVLRVKNAIKDKICIAYIAPAVRVAIGDAFGLPKGTFAQGKLVSALRKIGFKYVLDVTSGADLTIVEEASEFVRRLKNKGKLPMFTSCCPSWVRYAEMFYPELLPNLSTCKSPISMQGAIVREYFSQKYNLDKDELFTVAITPCTSKKYEITRKELPGTNAVLTTTELVEFLKLENIDFKNLENDNFDSLFGEGSGAGMIFGASGGVTEAVIRTVYKIMTGKNLQVEKMKLTPIYGISNIRELTIKVNNENINIAIINNMKDAKPILDDVIKGKSKYHFIEVMNCLGGCIGGGGQPKAKSGEEIALKIERMISLHKRDENQKLRLCHQNPDIVRLYDEFLEEPLSDIAEKLLHTKYTKK